MKGQQVHNLVVEMMLMVVDEEVLDRIDDVPLMNDDHLVVDMPAQMVTTVDDNETGWCKMEKSCMCLLPRK
ncbi:hypothetical protein Tco_1193780 [Tanacetum coccineum]